MSEGTYGIVFTQVALDQLADLNDPSFAKVESSLSLLKSFPKIGREYDPGDSGAFPPLTCRVLSVSKTTKTIYYLVNENTQMLRVFWIGDTRSDPMARFVGVHLKYND